MKHKKVKLASLLLVSLFPVLSIAQEVIEGETLDISPQDEVYIQSRNDAYNAFKQINEAKPVITPKEMKELKPESFKLNQKPVLVYFNGASKSKDCPDCAPKNSANEVVPGKNVLSSKFRNGIVYFSWGYNRAAYLPSTVHLKDEKDGQYDVTLHDIKAKDRPTKFSMYEYFEPQHIWIPQYNMRLGYMFGDKNQWGVEVNFDHMKYVMQSDQMVRVDGYLKDKKFDGSFVKPDWLKYEHTDGYNLVLVNAVHNQEFWSSKNGKYGVSLMNKVGAGPIIPRTDVSIKGVNGKGNDEFYRINNNFHFAGFGVGIETGLRVKFLKYGFTEWGVKGARVWMNNILVTGSGTKGTQNITSIEMMGTLGVALPVEKLKKKKNRK